MKHPTTISSSTADVQVTVAGATDTGANEGFPALARLLLHLAERST